MEARFLRAAAAASALVFLGASYRTPNFIVNAPTASFAAQVGKAAEEYRRDLAILWLGQALPKWAQPCPITLQVGPTLGAGGATSFVFDHGEVFNWQMSIQGSEERILDSVLPHEVTHTIFASHFRQPLPRWADEGACTTVEHESERAKQRHMLISFLKEDRGIAFSRMFAMKDYPPDVLPLYAQGFSLCRFLIEQKDRRTFVRFVGDGLDSGAWQTALERHYGYESLVQLQDTWLDWVRAGSPTGRRAPETRPGEPVLAANTPSDAVRQHPPRATAAAAPSESSLPAVAAANVPRRDKLVPIRRPDAAQSAAVQPLTQMEPAALAAAAIDVGAQQPAGVNEEPGPVADIAAAGVQPVQLTRPQGIERPQQRVLEWSQPSGVAATSLPGNRVQPALSIGPTAGAIVRPVQLSRSAAQRYLPAALRRPAHDRAAANQRSTPTALASSSQEN